MIAGTLTAMVTPFAHGRVDFDRLVKNVQFQIAGGVDGLVPMGTTGESPTLSHEEHRAVIERVVEAVRGGTVERRRRGSPGGRKKVSVVAGTGSNATSEALDLARHAKAVGADAVLSVNPYYNKPTQEGLYRHFMTLADAVEIPMILYNIPGRTGITMSPQTVARLAKHPNLAGIKEATGSLDIASEIAALVLPVRKDFVILSGDDSLTLPIMAVGGVGVISVLTNLVPKRVKAMVDCAREGDFARAQKLHLELFPLCKAMFIETNPIPIKTAMKLAGMDSGELRLPLCEMAGANVKVLEAVLHESRLTAR